MSVASLLVNTCTLTPITNGQSSTSAGMTTVVGTPVTSVACAIQTSSGREFVALGRETGRRFFDCYFAAGTTIDTRYRISSITGSSIGGLSGATLQVMSPPQDHAGRGSYLMVTAEEIQK